MSRCRLLGSACECGRSPIGLAVVTAADRAAATCQRRKRYKLISGSRRFPKGDRKALWSPPQRRNSPRLLPQKQPSAEGRLRILPTRVRRRAPAPQGRGGSVSRRDHNPAAEPRTSLSGGTNSEVTTPPNASRSSGEGVWGRGASLREAASPPESPPKKPLRRGPGGGASRREAPPRSSLAFPSLYLEYSWDSSA